MQNNDNINITPPPFFFLEVFFYFHFEILKKWYFHFEIKNLAHSLFICFLRACNDSQYKNILLFFSVWYCNTRSNNLSDMTEPCGSTYMYIDFITDIIYF